MRIHGRRVGDVRPADVVALVDGRVPESRTLEYKRELPGGRDDDKREFLADVSALANSEGGVILYGMDTERDDAGRDTGVARAAVGLPGANLDAEQQRLTSMLHDAVSPSLRAQVAFQPVTTDQGAPLLLLGVPRSLAGPHRVVYQRWNRFFRRSDAGKYEPDVPELRRMFVTAQSLFDEADAFRRERLRRIAAGEIRPDARAASQLFVHVLPLGRLDELLDLRAAANQLTSAAPLIGVSGWSDGYNADGYWTYNRARGVEDVGRLRAYAQWFRFGGAELYVADVAQPPRMEALGPAPVFRGPYDVAQLHHILPRVFGALAGPLAVDPPYVVALSLRGLRGAVMARDAMRYADAPTPLDRDELQLPMMLAEDSTADVVALLRPALTVLWQAFGEPGVPAEVLTAPAR